MTLDASDSAGSTPTGSTMTGSSAGSLPIIETDFRLFFQSLPASALVLAADTPRYTILAASDEYLVAAMLPRERLIGRPLFEVFTDENPDNAAPTGVMNLRASLETVARTGAPHRMGIQRYDVTRPDGTWAVRYWASRTDENANHFTNFAPWTPSNPSTSTPRALFGAPGASNSFAASDAYLESGNFIRIQQLELGWRLPEMIGKGSLGFRTGQSRLYVAVNNLHTFTDYTGYDPEVLGSGSILARGVDDGRIYPNVRTVTVGLSISQ